MAEREESEGRSIARAELFEALSHETRIGILRAIEGRPQTFAELKNELGLESSGNLQHHLGKLGDLVKQNERGEYVLTDDAKDALRMLDILATRGNGSGVGSGEKEPGWRPYQFKLSFWSLAVLAILTLILIACALWEPTTDMLMFVGSSLSFEVAYLLGASLWRLRSYRRLVASISFLFLSLWIFLYACAGYFVPNPAFAGPIPVMTIVVLLVWVPMYLYMTDGLLRAYDRER